MSDVSSVSNLPPLPPLAQARGENTQISSDTKSKKNLSLIFAGARAYNPSDIAPQSPFSNGTNIVKIVAAAGAFNNSSFTLPDLPLLTQAQKREMKNIMREKANQSAGASAILNFGSFSAFAAIKKDEERGGSIYDYRPDGRYRYTILDGGCFSQSYGGSFQLPVADNTRVGLGYSGNYIERKYGLETYHLIRSEELGYGYEDLLGASHGKETKHTNSMVLYFERDNISTNVIYSKQTSKSHGELIMTAGIQNLHFLDRLLRIKDSDPDPFWPPSFGITIEGSTDKKACVNVTIGDLINTGYIKKWGSDNYGQVYATISSGLGIKF